MSLAMWIPTSLLILSAALDLRYAKFPNWLFVSGVAIGALWLMMNHPWSAALISIFYSVLFFIGLAPLVYFKVFGAGDIKLLTALSLFVTVPSAATVLVYALFWGLLIGIIKIVLSGDIKVFTQSFVLRNTQVKSQKIPFAVAILIGWCSFLVAGDIL